MCLLKSVSYVFILDPTVPLLSDLMREALLEVRGDTSAKQAHVVFRCREDPKVE